MDQNSPVTNSLSKKAWWDYLSADLQSLLNTSFYLLDQSKSWETKFDDYSFVVFPAAKAYEGFLKKLFFDLELISEADFLGTHFRIGKALNPTLEKRLRDDSWVYPKLQDYCGGEELPQLLWRTWKECRNTVFHWFPREAKFLSLSDASDRLNLILEALDLAFTSCKIGQNFGKVR